MESGPPPNDLCSICHANFHIPCQANCSHWFCANCIMLVWQHASGTSSCKCPLCRRPITLLVPTEHSLSHRHDPEVAHILSKIHAYNRVFGGQPSSLFQRVQDLPFLLHRLLREFLNPQRSLPLVIRARVFVAVSFLTLSTSILAVFLNRLSMIASVVYILSPIDLIPEAMLGIVGLLDDVLIGLICFLHVAAIYRSVLYLRHAGS
ncbi:E3 ubiquitin-protein ligase RNF170 isoform X1 [Vigna unguiculata]|uniref:E3 ubiquitin-protein ligase RNF170 isoform X1 n=1 Tax=Vigna unguiculata TaxID=3917 RepID=UPI0010171002|nr:E3 ubiquitin-protein ligase RNF170 isoform X1 [Vigna unguiculata]